MHLKEIDANLLVTLDALLVDASVTRAAERLGRSASAISHALAKLREIFNDELFVRAGQRLVPTAKALELAPTVHVILAGMESLLRPDKPFDPTISVREFAAAASEAGELILIEPLRKRLQLLAPNVHVNWTPSRGDDTIDSLRSTRSHFLINVGGTRVTAPDVRVIKLFDDTLATVARPGHKMTTRKPKAADFASADHVAVDTLPTLEWIDRALAEQKLFCNVPLRVSSALVGVHIALTSDALLTVPSALATTLEKQFGLARIAQPLPPVNFPVRLMWHLSYDRDECHQWVRGEFANLAQNIVTA